MVLQLIRWNKKLLVYTAFYGMLCLSFDFLLINSMIFTFYTALRHITPQHKVSYLYVSLLSFTEVFWVLYVRMLYNSYECILIIMFIRYSFESCAFLKVRKYFICMYSKEDMQLNLNFLVKWWKIINSQIWGELWSRSFLSSSYAHYFLRSGWESVCVCENWISYHYSLNTKIIIVNFFVKSLIFALAIPISYRI